MSNLSEHIVKIEKLSNLGYGIAKINGKVIFVKDSCPHDKIKIRIIKETKNYSYGEIIEIITPSPHRTDAFCPMHKVCGSCQLQHINYDYQMELKQEIVSDVMHSIGNISIDIPKTIPSPQIKNYRHKIQYPITETKNSKRIIAGYYKHETHEIVNIKYCPIQPEICDKIIEYIRQKATQYGVSGYIERNHSGLLRHVLIRNSSINDSNLVVLILNTKKITQNIKDFAESIYNSFDEVCGVCINFNTQKSNIILGKETHCIYGKEVITEKILDKIFYIGAETFFQINPKSAENIFKYVKNYITNNMQSPLILDAYAGISAFGICLSDVAKKVVTMEENKKSVELAKKSIIKNNITNIEIHCANADDFFKKEERQFDAIILDPPRKGCSNESLENAFKLCKDTIIYVSCNPATLARDLKYLAQKGCRIESIQPFDMFCHTYHIENVAIIKVR